MYKTALTAILLITVTLLYSQTGTERFISPVGFPMFLSSNFAELRGDHFHSGIDIKTEGVTGKEIYSVADGYVYLILVSPTGFGKAIYIRHASGLSSVYAHLERFSAEVDSYIRDLQYLNKSFSITTYPPENLFKIRQGQLIGYSGNTGSSGGPHLHFEIRRTDGEKPLNPLDFGFDLTDNLKPVIEKIALYPLSPASRINGNNSKVIFKVTGKNGLYSLTDQKEITVSGKSGISIEARDLINYSSNKFGISELILEVDSVKYFSYKNSEFFFHETRYINAHIDYEALVNDNIELQRLFRLPGNRLGTYGKRINNGVLEFNDTLTHKIRITVADCNGNKSFISFNIRSILPAGTVNTVMPRSYSAIMSWTTRNRFESGGFSIDIPEGALYDTLYFTYSEAPMISRSFSRIFQVHNASVPLHKAALIQIKPDSVPKGKESALALMRIDDMGKMSFAGGTYREGVVEGEIRTFGNYTIGIDTIAPVITPLSFSEGSDLSGRTEIRIKIKDAVSGIGTYSGLIDNEWVLFEYDPKTDMLVYRFDQKRIKKGIVHKLQLTVTDNRRNTTVLTRNFKW
jgi:hypothetical protein